MADPEQDDDTEAGTDGTNQITEQPRRQITLTVGERTVNLEGPDGLDEMAKLAAYFWLLISPPREVRSGFTAGGTLITELADPWDEADNGPASTNCAGVG